jgi:hypothetical protein
MGFPAMSLMSREITAVYVVLPVKTPVGVKTAMSPSRATTLETLAPPVVVSVKVDPLTVEALTGSENFAVKTVAIGTAVIESPGETATTRGGVASRTGARTDAVTSPPQAVKHSAMNEATPRWRQTADAADRPRTAAEPEKSECIIAHRL